MPERTDLPRGTVCFLFTDAEGSTRLWERDPAAAAAALGRQEALLRAAVAGHGGAVFKAVGDGLCAAFGGRRRPSPPPWPGSGRCSGRTGRRWGCRGRCGCGWPCTRGRPRPGRAATTWGRR
jgi:class 3 adenylate cyclase